MLHVAWWFERRIRGEMNWYFVVMTCGNTMPLKSFSELMPAAAKLVAACSGCNLRRYLDGIECICLCNRSPKAWCNVWSVLRRRDRAIAHNDALYYNLIPAGIEVSEQSWSGIPSGLLSDLVYRSALDEHRIYRVQYQISGGTDSRVWSTHQHPQIREWLESVVDNRHIITGSLELILHPYGEVKQHIRTFLGRPLSEES